MCSRVRWLVALGVMAVAAGGAVRGGEAPERKAEPKAKPAATTDTATDVVARVDDTRIQRSELIEERRRLALRNRNAPLPNNEVILDRLIHRVLWERYLEKENLAPTGAEVQQAIQNIDRRLQQRGSSYQDFLSKAGLTVESHAAQLRYELGMRRLIEKLADAITEEEIRTEYEAHPQFYDGSRVRISQIFVDTANISNDPKKLAEAKEKIQKCHEELKEGKEFKHVANDRSEGPAASRGGDRGWFVRKPSNMPDEDEKLLEAAWDLKVGDYTEPLRGARGWHILKVTDREPAHFTYFGCKRRIREALVREKVEALLEELKGKAKIEKSL